jgi:predicted alpha/beta-fold hydrolase
LKNHEERKCKVECIELKHTSEGAFNVSNKIQIKNLPNRQPFLEGRFKDCYKIWQNLMKNRLVWIYGISGIGKSALVHQLAHILYDRDVFKDGIFYLSLKNCSLLEHLVNRFYTTFLESLTSKKSKEEFEKYYNYEDEEKYNACLSMMVNLEILMIFDDCDMMINYSEAVYFEKFIDDLTTRVPE